MSDKPNFIVTLTKGPGAKYLAIAFGVIIIMASIYNGATSGFNNSPNISLSLVGFIITGVSTVLFLYKHDPESFKNITSSLSSSSTPASP